MRGRTAALRRLDDRPYVLLPIAQNICNICVMGARSWIGTISLQYAGALAMKIPPKSERHQELAYVSLHRIVSYDISWSQGAGRAFRFINSLTWDAFQKLSDEKNRQRVAIVESEYEHVQEHEAQHCRLSRS